MLWINMITQSPFVSYYFHSLSSLHFITYTRFSMTCPVASIHIYFFNDVIHFFVIGWLSPWICSATIVFHSTWKTNWVVALLQWHGPWVTHLPRAPYGVAIILLKLCFRDLGLVPVWTCFILFISTGDLRVLLIFTIAFSSFVKLFFFLDLNLWPRVAMIQIYYHMCSYAVGSRPFSLSSQL